MSLPDRTPDRSRIVKDLGPVLQVLYNCNVPHATKRYVEVVELTHQKARVSPRDTTRKDRKEAAPRIKERRARRVHIECRMFLFGEDDFEAEARVIDLSTGGCRAVSAVPVEVGMELKLSLFLGDQRWPVRIDGAVVRWVAGDTFGLEFYKLLPSIQHRIRQFVWNCKGKDA